MIGVDKAADVIVAELCAVTNGVTDGVVVAYGFESQDDPFEVMADGADDVVMAGQSLNE